MVSFRYQYRWLSVEQDEVVPRLVDHVPMNADIPAEMVLLIAGLTTFGTVLVALIGMAASVVNARIGATAMLREPTKAASIRWSQERATALAATAHEFLRALTLARQSLSRQDPVASYSDAVGLAGKLSAFDADLGRQALFLATETIDEGVYAQKIKSFTHRLNKVCAFEEGNLRGEPTENEKAKKKD